MKNCSFFKKKKLTLRCIQSVLFFQSIYVTLYILVFAYRIAMEEELEFQDRVFYSIVMILPPIFTILVLLPEVLPLYTIANCVGTLTRKDLVLMTQQLDSQADGDRDLAYDGEDEPNSDKKLIGIREPLIDKHNNPPIEANPTTTDAPYYEQLDIQDDEKKPY